MFRQLLNPVAFAAELSKQPTIDIFTFEVTGFRLVQTREVQTREEDEKRIQRKETLDRS